MTKFKRDVEEIDEAALLQSIFEQDNNSGNSQTNIQAKPVESVAVQPDYQDEIKVSKEPVKRKRNHVDYSSLFLQRNELKERSCVYISRKIHNTISEIVRVIADRDVTVGGYIDNVLLQHLELHRDEINDLYKKERRDLI